MPDPKRQKLVDAIIARMQTISTASPNPEGYQTNIGSNVHDWRVNFQDDELPAVSVCDMTAEAQSSDSPNPLRTIYLMPVQVRIYAKKGEDPANIRLMISDVMRAIRQDDRWMVADVGLAMITRPLRDGFIIPEESFEVIGAVVEFEIQFITGKFNAEE